MKGDPARNLLARRILALSRVRSSILCDHNFGDHAWALLLRIFVAQSSNQVLSIESAFREARLTPTLGIRWLRHLASQDMVTVSNDETDVTLTARGAERMRAYLDRCAALDDQPD